MRVCVVGVGALGRHHARILSQLPGVELVAVADPAEQQGRQVAESCGCEWTPDYRTLLNRVDAVSIVVPTSLHLSVGRDFLTHDVPVLIEKPLAGTVAAGEELVRIAAERGLPLQVGHIERFNPAYRELNSRCGTPKYIRAERMSPYPFRSTDIGVVHDLMIHDLELIVHLVGEQPEQVEAFGVSVVGGHEDCVQARLRFPSGCLADVTAHRVCPVARRSIQVWSDQGCVTADLQTRQVLAFTPGLPIRAGQLPFELAQRPGADIPTMKSDMFGHYIAMEEVEGSSIDALTVELNSFLDAVRDGSIPEVEGHHALQALRVAEQVLQSVQAHQWDGTETGRVGPMALLDMHVPGRLSAQKAA